MNLDFTFVEEFDRIDLMKSVLDQNYLYSENSEKFCHYKDNSGEIFIC
jgi:hypothetical protein